MAEGGPQGSGRSNRPNMPEDDPRTSQRIFKKSSANNKVTLYVACRDLVLEPNRKQRVEGVLLVDPEYAENKNIYGQIIVIFRYGREDEEIMGLQFFNETTVNVVRIWPTCHSEISNVTRTSPLQETLVTRLGPNAIPFHMEVCNKSPPSVVLSPTKPYDGQPVGTSYDIRVFMDEELGDMGCRQIIVRMGIRVTHSASRIDTAPLLTPSPSTESFRVKPRYQRLKVQCRPRAPVVENPSDPVTEDESAQMENETVNKENIESRDQENNQRNAVNERRNDMEWSENGGESNRSEDRSDNNEEIQGNEEISVDTESAVPVAPRPAPRVSVEKSFLLSEGKVHLESWLDKSSYHHGEKIIVNFRIVNNSTKTVQRIKAYVFQYVDVRMFDNGKFKNVVATAKDSNNSVPPGQSFQDYYTMRPRVVTTKNWIALEATCDCLASTVICHPEDDKRLGISSIFISYYVKLALSMNKLGGEMSVKLPFSLSRAPLHDSAADSSTEESANRTEKEDTEGEVDDVANNDHNEINADVNDGNAPIGNQASNSQVNPDGRQSVSADVPVNIIENKLGEGSHFGGLPKPDEEINPLVQYLETNI